MTTTMPTRNLDRLSRSGLSAADLENLDDDLSGRTVHDRTGEEIGTVEDVLVDTVQLRATFILVSWGGVLGIGKQQRLIPLEAIDRVTPEGVYLKGEKELVTAGPAYRDDLSGPEAEALYAQVYDAYGIKPALGSEQPLS
jgi:sporulation protein YlmC with PRC-barrel domain